MEILIPCYCNPLKGGPYWGCPHCGARLEKIDVVRKEDLRRLVEIYKIPEGWKWPGPSRGCPSCHLLWNWDGSVWVAVGNHNSRNNARVQMLLGEE